MFQTPLAAYVRRAGRVAVELLISAMLFFVATLAIVLLRPFVIGAGVDPAAYGILGGGVIVVVFAYIGLRGFPE